MSSTKLIQKKVREYETFLNDRLRQDLKRAWDERDRLFSEIAEYERLRVTLTTLDELYKKNQTNQIDEPLQTQIDLVGFGLFCELTYDEARTFIEKKLPSLHEQEADLSKKIALIKGNIKLVLQALKEIQSIEDRERPAEIVASF